MALKTGFEGLKLAPTKRGFKGFEKLSNVYCELEGH